MASARSRASVSGPASAATSTLLGRAVEPSNLHVHRVDGPAAHGLHDAVAHLLRHAAALEVRAMLLCHLHRVLTAQEVRSVEQVDVQGVALEPFAAVEETAEVCDAADRRSCPGRPPRPRTRSSGTRPGRCRRYGRSGLVPPWHDDRAGRPRRTGAVRRSAARRPPPGRPGPRHGAIPRPRQRARPWTETVRRRSSADVTAPPLGRRAGAGAKGD